MTKVHAQERYAAPQRKVADDLQRENDQMIARRIEEDFLHDDDLMTDVRQSVEQTRVNVEAYGARISTQAYIDLTLDALATALKMRHVKEPS